MYYLFTVYIFTDETDTLRLSLSGWFVLFTECPYGDRNAVITRRNDDDGREETFTCSTYVQRYGDFHCRTEPRFRQYCCETCQ